MAKTKKHIGEFIEFPQPPDDIVIQDLGADEESASLPIRLLGLDGVVPMRSGSNSAGYDLKASASTVIMPGGMSVIPTGIALGGNEKLSAFLSPVQALSNSGVIMTNAGSQCNDGKEIFVSLMNFKATPLFVGIGDRIGKFVLIGHQVANFKISNG